MSINHPPLHLFEGYGVELEYMVVRKGDLSVLPVVDKIIQSIAGEYVAEIELKDVAWSNELVLHVIELKTNGPARSLVSLSELFHANIQHINTLLSSHDGILLPTGAHPLMDPHTESKLWPHEYNEVYEAYNRIFGCKGHGWSNLQSTHLNLPFGNDDEFGRLHAAIRLVLPIIPALSASTPILDGKVDGILDRRLEVYRLNQKKIPAIAGEIIPERVFSRHDYETHILQRIYSDIAPYDTDNILKYEWLNSRGAIARFNRNAIEIRIIDIQECPLADIAILALVIETLKVLVNELWIPYTLQKEWDENRLAKIFLNMIKYGGNTLIDDPEYLRVFGYTHDTVTTAWELWSTILNNLMPAHDDYFVQWRTPLEIIIKQGSLAQRILKALDDRYTPDRIRTVYKRLADCLHTNRLFIP